MLLVVQIVISLALLAIAYMDFRYRYVQLYLFILLFFTSITYAIVSVGVIVSITQFMANSVLLLLMLGMLWTYFSVKAGLKEGFVNRKIGAGDIALWLAITPLFSSGNFLLFLTASLLLVLLLVLFQLTVSKQNLLIPLAGWQAVILFVLVQLNIFYPDMVCISPGQVWLREYGI